MLEVAFLGPPPRKFSRQQTTPVSVLRAENIGFEVEMMRQYQALSMLNTNPRTGPTASIGRLSPLLKGIIHGPQPLGASLTTQKGSSRRLQDAGIEIKQLVQSMCVEHNLNEPQCQCLRHTANWFLSDCDRYRPSDGLENDSSTGQNLPHETRAVELIHGVFGAGKSFTVALVLELACRIVDMCQLDVQILLTAATNNAVDGVLRCVSMSKSWFVFPGPLCSLVEHTSFVLRRYLTSRGFSSFVRIGNKPAVHPDILPYFSTGLSKLDNTKCVPINGDHICCLSHHFHLMDGFTLVFITTLGALLLQQ